MQEIQNNLIGGFNGMSKTKYAAEIEADDKIR